jgi:hypothetical protein
LVVTARLKARLSEMMHAKRSEVAKKAAAARCWKKKEK